MIIGVPKEIKVAECRVALLPSACAELLHAGHEVIVQHEAGVLSGYSNEEYSKVGCTILKSIEEIYDNADLIVKVKEPQVEEFSLLQSRHLLFCFLHLAAEPEVEQALIKSNCTAIAFEGVTDSEGGLPLLKPMSVIAGKLAVQYASVYLHRNYGGRGILIDGLDSVAGANATVLGFGSAGKAATIYLQRLGAKVTLIDKVKHKLERAAALGSNITAVESNADNIERAVCESDFVIGAVLIPGARAPVIVKKDWVAKMPAGAVIIDIAVDQGGCIETTKPTTYKDPTYIWEGVIHFAVQNMPAAVPRTASQALSYSILPVVAKIADGTWTSDSNISAGLIIRQGEPQ